MLSTSIQVPVHYGGFTVVQEAQCIGDLKRPFATQLYTRFCVLDLSLVEGVEG